jgi:hypothetical protein
MFGSMSPANPAGTVGEVMVTIDAKISRATDGVAAFTCVAAGVLIAALPHLIAWTKTGRMDHVSNDDERYYLAIGSQAYFNHPCFITDPVLVAESPTAYRPLPTLPGIWAAKFLGLGPLGVGLMWRVLAGVTIGLGWYLLFRSKVSRPGVAASLSLILLCDHGLTYGTPFVRLFRWAAISALLPAISPLAGGNWIHLEWRIINPATTMVYLIAFIWAVLRAREAPTRAWIATAGLTFGVLFYVYFYYWTAAGLAILLALVLDVGHRRVYFHAGWIGALIGLPAILSDYLIMHSRPADWLARNDRFVPIGRFEHLVLPREILLLAVLGLAFVLMRRRDLVFVWALGLAGLLLENSQVVTQLQFENFHWRFVWGPAFSLLVLLAVATAIEAREGWSAAISATLGAVAGLAFCAGLGLRAMEATRCADRVANDRVIAAYRSQFSPGINSRFTPNAVAGGDRDFVDFAAILTNLRPLSGWAVHNSPAVTTAELHDRDDLNELLLGLDRSSFPAKQIDNPQRVGVGPSERNTRLLAGAAGRVSDEDRKRADLAAALDRFKVRYVGLPAGTEPSYLRHGWTRILGGPTWDVWERISDSRP